MEKLDFVSCFISPADSMVSPFAQWSQKPKSLLLFDWIKYLDTDKTNNTRQIRSEILFFSDVHLRAQEPEKTKEFINQIEQICRNHPVGLIVSLGDCFDWWYGSNPFFEKLYKPFIQTMENLSQEMELKWIFFEGNHDINLRAIEKRFSFLKVITEDLWLILENSQQNSMACHLSHGDLVNYYDTPYLKLRRILRSGPLEKISAKLPAPLLYQIGQSLSNLSRSRRQGALPFKKVEQSKSQLNSALDHCLQLLIEQGCSAAILGHFHQKRDQFFQGKNQFQSQQIRYLNLGYFPSHHTFLKFRRGEFEWMAG